MAWQATDWTDAALGGSVGRGRAAARGFGDALVGASDASLREGAFKIALGGALGLRRMGRGRSAVEDVEAAGPGRGGDGVSHTMSDDLNFAFFVVALGCPDA